MNSVVEPLPIHEPSATERALVDELLGIVEPRLSERQAAWGTYRLQFTAAQFRFAEATAIANYLARLGVSHVYASPLLKSRSGSTHGYDIVDYTRLNDELGGDEGFETYSAALAANGLRQIVDIVPNHMCVSGDGNAWWMDVLANGPASPYAGYFDIDWHPTKGDLENRVLLPVLGDFYGNVLEAGQLVVRYHDGAFFVDCYGSQLPLGPKTWPRILSPNMASLEAEVGAETEPLHELLSIITALNNLPDRTDTSPERMVERQRERAVIRNRLRRVAAETPAIVEHIERNLDVLNGTVGEPHSFDELDRLLNDQAFHLVHWKAGGDELNYRRFFDVTELAAVCMEHAEVFETTHRRVFELLVRQKAHGVRIDHIDGLFDPTKYLWRLQWGYVRELGKAEHARLKAEREIGPDEALPTWSALEPLYFDRLRERVENRRPPPLFVEVEKILGVDEPLPTEWPVAGTTGYDFLNLVGGLFVDDRGYRELERQYRRFVGLRKEFRELVYECKRVILDGPMQSELQLLAHRLERISTRHRRSRDFTLLALRSALREIIACFPVYRSYVRDGNVSERDRRVVNLAVAQARRLNPATDASVYSFIRDVLLLGQPADLDAEGLAQRELFVGRFQQVTSPVMAKGIEDTLFYRFVPLSSVDEVGGDLQKAPTSVEEFHKQNAARAAPWPHTMLATTTHDTKRSEDVRARISVLSEVPRRWTAALRKFTRANRKHLREVDGKPAPSPNDEWLFYQTLVGVWPLVNPTDEDRAELIRRLQQYMEKATHEAKLRTSWISPNPAYDEAVKNFVAAALGDMTSLFLTDFQTFEKSIVNAGLFTAASQALLKFVSPGIPDLYQGQEVWDFSLVDPDNRRSVEYEYRRRHLADIERKTSTPGGRLELARQLAQHPRDQRMKLFVTCTALEFRKEWTDLLDRGRYVPLTVAGTKAAHVCAFAWIVEHDDGQPPRIAVVAVPRLVLTLTGENDGPPCGAAIWEDTAIAWPEGVPTPTLRDRFTGRQIEVENGKLAVANLLKEFPVALATT